MSRPSGAEYLEAKGRLVGSLIGEFASGNLAAMELVRQLRGMSEEEQLSLVLLRRTKNGTIGAIIGSPDGMMPGMRPGVVTGSLEALRDMVPDRFIRDVLDGKAGTWTVRGGMRGGPVVVRGLPVEAAWPQSNQSGSLGLFLYRDASALLQARSARLAGILSGFALAFVLITAITAAVLYFVTRRLSRPLEEVAHVANGILEGDYSRRVSPRGAMDEVADIADSVNRMVDRLATLETTRREFIANVSHELRTPLTIIRGNLQGIQDGVIPGEEAAEALTAAMSETRRMEGLVNELIDLSVLQGSEFSLEAEDTDLTALFLDVAALAGPVFRTRGAALDARIQEGIQGSVDAGRIRQVMMNLLDNASRYAPADSHVLLEARQEKGLLRVRVRDQGPGIPPDQMPHLFERYRRPSGRSGSGLGLPLCKAIVEAHRGRIQAESDGKSFTEVSFQLPI